MLQTTLLQRRSNGYYYFRWVCPPAIRKLLGKREIVKSLRTTSKFQALARAGAYYMAVDGLKEVAMQSHRDLPSIEDEQKLDQLCSTLYQNVVSKAFSSYLGLCDCYSAYSLKEAQEKQEKFLNLVKSHQLAATNFLGEYRAGASIFDRTKSLLEVFAKLDSEILEVARTGSMPEEIAIHDHHKFVEAIYCKLFGMLGETLSQSDKWHQKYIYDLTQVLHKSYEIKRDKLDPSKSMPALPVFDIERLAIVERDTAALMFTELFEEFLSYKISHVNLSKRLQKEYKSSFPIFLHFIGDVPVVDITSKMIRNCLLSCLRLPKRNLKPYKGMPIAELASMEVPEQDKLASKSVEGYRKLLQGIFAYAKQQEYVKQSPAVDLNLNIKIPKKKAPFSNAEVKQILSASLGLTGTYEHHKWVVLLGAYTGARLGEIVQLRAADIKTDLGSDTLYLRITSDAGSLKTDNANRVIPIHSKLIELGFKSFVAAAGSDGQIFSGIADSKAITRWFPSFLRGLAIEKLDDYGRSRTFHSFRHSFITEVRGNGLSLELVQAVVGHEKTSAGQTDIYTGSFSIEKLKPVVESITYL